MPKTIEPVFYQDMTASAQSTLVESGVAHDCAVSMARNIVKDFCEKHRGRVVRVPTLRSKEVFERDVLIRKDYETLTIAEICKKHRVSLATARNAVEGIVKPDKYVWSEDEVEKLIASWSTTGSRTRIKGKTTKQITNRAHYLGLGSGGREGSEKSGGSGFND